MVDEPKNIKEGLRGGTPRDRMLKEEAEIKEGLRGGTPRPGAQPTPSVPPPAPTPPPTPSAPTPPSAPAPQAPTPPPVEAAAKTGMKIGKIILIGGVVVVGTAVIGGVILVNMLKQKAGISDIDVYDGGIKITTEDDGVLQLENELPSDFPKDFPIYPNNITLENVLRVSDPDFDEVFNVIWQVKDPYNIVGNYYRAALPANGWEITVLSDVFGVEEGVAIIFSKPDRGVSVHITKTGEFECEILAIVSK